MKRLAALAATTSLLIAAFAAPANAAVVAAGPGGFAAGFATPIAVTTVGGPLVFFNGDIQPHNVIATEDFLPKKTAKKTEWCKGYPKTKCPLFWSKTVPVGQQTPVLGTENLESGSQYEFFCSVHPGMKGTLVAL